MAAQAWAITPVPGHPAVEEAEGVAVGVGVAVFDALGEFVGRSSGEAVVDGDPVPPALRAAGVSA